MGLSVPNCKESNDIINFFFKYQYCTGLSKIFEVAENDEKYPALG